MEVAVPLSVEPVLVANAAVKLVQTIDKNLFHLSSSIDQLVSELADTIDELPEWKPQDAEGILQLNHRGVRSILSQKDTWVSTRPSISTTVQSMNLY